MFGKLATLFVDVQAQTKGFEAGIAASHKGLLGLSTMATLGFAAVGAGVAYGAYKAVKASSDLFESTDKMGVVFGNASKDVTEFADKMASDFGYVKTTVLDAEARFAGLGKGIGNLEGKDLTKFTNQFTQLAADMKSLHNIDFEEAITALASGLSGETEPLKRFGVIVSENNVKAKAYAMGLAKVGKELTDQQKLQARVAIIMEKTGDAQGNLAQTAGSFANQLAKLWGNFQNTLASVGSILMPVGQRLLALFNGVGKGITDFVAAHGPAITAWSESVGAAFDWVVATVSEVVSAIVGAGTQLVAEIQTWEAYRVAVEFLGKAWEWLRDTGASAFATLGAIYRNFGTFAAIVFVTAKGYVMNMGEAVAWFVSSSGTLLEWFGRNWVSLFADTFEAALTVVKNFASNVWENMKALWAYIASGGTASLELSWTPLLTGFKKTMEDLPDIAAPVFSSLRSEIDALGEQMAEAEGKRAAAMGAADGGGKADGSLVPGLGALMAAGKAAGRRADDLMKKADKAKFVGIEAFGKELQTAILGKDNDARRTADGVHQVVAEQRATKKAIEKLGRMPARAG